MAGKTTLTEVKAGVCDIVDLAKLNALLDMELATNHAEAEKARNRQR